MTNQRLIEWICLAVQPPGAAQSFIGRGHRGRCLVVMATRPHQTRIETLPEVRTYPLTRAWTNTGFP
jgi:hypothetical protein